MIIFLHAEKCCGEKKSMAAQAHSAYVPTCNCVLLHWWLRACTEHNCQVSREGTSNGLSKCILRRYPLEIFFLCNVNGAGGKKIPYQIQCDTRLTLVQYFHQLSYSDPFRNMMVIFSPCFKKRTYL